MSPDLAFFCGGDPQGKGRPRSRIAYTREGKPYVNVYTDAATRAYERAIGYAAKAAMRRAGLREPFDCALRVRITAIFEVPASWSQKKREAALSDQVRHTSKPDFDNCAKVIDACNEIVWRDDSIIVDARVIKCYGLKPGLYVEVWQWIPSRLI